MNRFIKNTIRAGLMALAIGLPFASCSDNWDEHYESSAGLSYGGSILEYLKTQTELSDFVEILNATGYANELQSSQVLTVVAPKNDSFDKAELLSLIANGKKQQVIDEFVKNHVCRYNVSIGAESQSVTMLNKKNIEFGSIAESTINGYDVSKKNISCQNGVVHVIDAYLPYQYNIYEYLAKNYNDNIDAISTEDGYETYYGYLTELYIDSLDEARSVSRGVDENGDNIWVDSVTITNNKILAKLDAYLYREDSTYLAILPTFDAYNDRYQGIKGLFNFNVSYNSDPVVRDSVQRYYSHYFSMCDLNYNMGETMNHAYNDSLFSTAFSRRSWPYYVYYNPYQEGGIMANYTQTIDCSNGSVYMMNQYPFSVFSNVFKKITLEGENAFYLYEDGDNLFTNTATTGYAVVSNSADSISGSGYLHVTPKSSNRNTEFTYQLPNTLSGQYDIYVKFLPYQVYAPEDTTHTNLPVQFRASLYERTDNTGAYPAETKPTYEFSNEGSKNFQTKANEIDSLYIGTYKFNYCYYGTTPGVLFKLESYVLTSQAKNYTKEMLIDKIVLIPNRERHDFNGLYIPEEEE